MASLNPLHCTGTALRPHVLLAVKALFLCLIFKGYATKFTDVFVPVWPVLDLLPVGLLRPLLIAIFWGAGTTLLLNRAVRSCCIALGIVYLLAMSASIPAYRNAQVFCGLFFLMVGLTERDGDPWLLRWQVIVLYFGCGVNKFCEPDWRSGQYMEYWLREIVGAAPYGFVADLLPAMLLSWLLCWMTIIIELVVLPAGFAIRRFNRTAIWIAVFFHGASLALTHNDFGIFFSAILLSLFSFIRWPRSITLLYDASDPVSLRRSRYVEMLRHSHLMAQVGVAPAVAPTERRFSVTVDGQDVGGFAAVQAVVGLSALTWLIMCIMVTEVPVILKYLPFDLNPQYPALAFGVVFFSPVTARLVDSRLRRRENSPLTSA